MRLAKDWGYEEDLVRLVVGSLSTPNNFKCIDVNYNGRQIDERILVVSARGSLLVGEEAAADAMRRMPFGLSLDYLQLVIDDPWLRYPAPWAPKIAIPDVDIGYTLKPAADYGAQSLVYLNQKLPATLTFLRVLEASWISEVHQHPEVRRLAPKFEEAAEHILTSIRRVLRSYGEPGSRTSATLEEQWALLRGDSSHETWWSNFREDNPDVSA